MRDKPENIAFVFALCSLLMDKLHWPRSVIRSDCFSKDRGALVSLVMTRDRIPGTGDAYASVP
jgi:hypothetical protein